MRHLQFRAWDLIEKKMDEIYELDNSGDYDRNWYVKFEHGDKEQAWNCNVHIMQSTGILDKNNKLIYEGDIVKTDPKHLSILFRNKEETGEYTAGVVMWWNEGFAVCQSTIGASRISDFKFCDCCPSGLEIIGNLYENPELVPDAEDTLRMMEAPFLIGSIG